MEVAAIKPLRWIASSRKDLGVMPDQVRAVFGYALFQAQIGRKPDAAKPLKGFGSAAVLEVTEDWRGDTYRAVYTVRYAHAVYVLHCFQKKSAKGAQTPKPDMALIRERLKAVDALARGITT
jgi:phage-related protein